MTSIILYSVVTTCNKSVNNLETIVLQCIYKCITTSNVGMFDRFDKFLLCNFSNICFNFTVLKSKQAVIYKSVTCICIYTLFKYESNILSSKGNKSDITVSIFLQKQMTQIDNYMQMIVVHE